MRAFPDLLRATILRKHIATMCVNFIMNENDVSELANFMGHADKIHKEHYRQPILRREILNISRLLEAVQGKANSDDSDYSDIAEPEVEQNANKPSADSSVRYGKLALV